MLKQEINDLLTQTGPGTPMGEMFRQYWIPALLAEELPENDCPPVRVKLLSERLIAFRDSEGRYGLMDEFCAHRGVSLWFGRNEEGGLRCAYHGWKYDVTGQAIEIPSEPDERHSALCAKIKLTSYPMVKVGAVLWTYMGDPAKTPDLPQWEFARVPAEQSFTSKRWQECNWLQALEGGIDSSHVSWLHSDGLKNDPLFKGAKGNKYNLADKKPFFEVVESDGGLFIGVRRNAEEGHYYWRITPWVMPSFTMIPPRGDHPIHGHFWIPIDDENCWVFTYDYHPVRPLTESEVQHMKDGQGVHNEFVPGTYRPLQNKDNDYMMDRAAQKRGDTYSGVKGISMQDASLQESMGPVVDRGKERLVSTDSGIIMARRKLWRAVEALRDEGVTPPGVNVAHQEVRSAAVVLPKEQSFTEGAADALRVRPGEKHASVWSVPTTQQQKPTLLSSCAVATTATEARYRITAPEFARRSSRVIALDGGSGEIVRDMGGRSWDGGHFLVFESAVPDDALLRHAGAGGTALLSEELDGADTVVMVASAGANAEAASIIGDAAAARGIMSAGLVLPGSDPVNEVVSALRPNAMVLVVLRDGADVPEILAALRV